MTQQRLDEIRARCDAATRGPWKYHIDIGKKYYIHSPTYGVRDFCCLTSGFEREADAVFVTEARQDIPALLAEVERLRAERRWIPVEERLPECDARWGCSKIVWCCDAHGRSGFGIYQNGTSQLRHASWFTGGGVAEESVMVTHWMPLPDPIGRKEG